MKELIDKYKRGTTKFSQLFDHGEVIQSNYKELFELSDDLYTLTVDQKSQIFLDIWKQQMYDTLRGNNKLDNIFSCVWEPVINSCTELLLGLYSKQIVLSRVDKHFKGLNSIETQLHDFWKAMKLVLSKNKEHQPFPEKNSWLDDRITTIRQYWNFESYSNYSNTFLDLKKALKIHGDFGAIQHLVSNVSMCVI